MATSGAYDGLGTATFSAPMDSAKLKESVTNAYKHVRNQDLALTFARIVCSDFDAFGVLRAMSEPNLKEFLAGPPENLSSAIPVEIDKAHPRRRPGTIWLYGLLGVPEVVIDVTYD